MAAVSKYPENLITCNVKHEIMTTGSRPQTNGPGVVAAPESCVSVQQISHFHSAEHISSFLHVSFVSGSPYFSSSF